MKVLEEVNKFRSELEAALRIVQQMRGEFEAVGKQVAEAAEKLRDGLSSKKDIEVVKAAKEAQQLAKQAQQIAKSQKALQETELKILKQKQKLEEEIKFLKTEEAKQLEKLKQERQRLAKALKDEIRSQKSAYQDQVVRLNEIKAKLKDLLVLQRQLSKEGKTNTEEYAHISQEIEKLQAEFKEVDATVRAAEQSVGEYQRNVGNYANDIRSVLGDVISGFSDLGGEGVRAFISVGDAAKNAAVSFGRLLKSLIRVRKEGFGGLKASAIAFGGAVSMAMGAALGAVKTFFSDTAADVVNFAKIAAGALIRLQNPLKAIEDAAEFTKAAARVRDLERKYGALEVQIAETNKQIQEEINVSEDESKTFDERKRAIEKEIQLRKQATDAQIEYYSQLKQAYEGMLANARGKLSEEEIAKIEDEIDKIAKKIIELQTDTIGLSGERQRRLLRLVLENVEESSKAILKQIQTLTDFSQNAISTDENFWSKYLELLGKARDETINSIESMDTKLRQIKTDTGEVLIDTGEAFRKFAKSARAGALSAKDFTNVFSEINKLPESVRKEILDTFNELVNRLLVVNKQINDINLQKPIRDIETYLELLEKGYGVTDFLKTKDFSEEFGKMRVSITYGRFFREDFDPEKEAEDFLKPYVVISAKRKKIAYDTFKSIDAYQEVQKQQIMENFKNNIRFLKNEYEAKRALIQKTIKDEEDKKAALLKLELEYQNKVGEAIERYNDEQNKLIEEVAERRKKILMDALSDFQSFSNQIMSVFQENLRRQAQGIDKQIQSLQGIAQVQAELAARGIDNSLVEIERKLREAEAKRREREQRERRLAKVQAYFNALVEYMKADPNTAPFKALVQIAIAEAIAGRFKEGVENFKGKGGPKDDANLVLISTGESIITAEATKRYKGLPTAMNEGRVEKWVQERYNSTVDFTKLGEWIVNTIQDGVKKREVLRKRPF